MCARERPIDLTVSRSIARVQRLTNQQHSVFCLIGHGLSNRMIAQHLGVTEKTVKSHVTQVLRILEVESRTQVAIVSYAISLIRAGVPLETPDQSRASDLVIRPDTLPSRVVN